MPPTNEVIKIEKIKDIECAWINPDKAKEGGIILSFHGGAYVSGCARSCFPYLAPLCTMTNMAGCSVGYSLCPEHILPAAINDGLTIYKYLLDEMKINPKQILFCGDSAGGSLVLLLIQKLIRDEMPIPCCAVTMSAWDVPSEGPSYIENAEKDSLFDQATGKLWAHLAVGNIDVDVEKEKCYWLDVRSSLDQLEYSYLHKDASFKGFCPLFLSTSENELLASDSLRVVDRCKEDRVKDVVCEVTPSNGLHVLEDWIGYGVPESLSLLQKEAAFMIKYLQRFSNN